MCTETPLLTLYFLCRKRDKEMKLGLAVGYETIEPWAVATTLDANLIQTSRVKLQKREKEKNKFTMLSEFNCTAGGVIFI